MSGYGDQLSAWVKAKREPQGLTTKPICNKCGEPDYCPDHHFYPNYDAGVELQRRTDAAKRDVAAIQAGLVTPAAVAEYRERHLKHIVEAQHQPQADQTALLQAAFDAATEYRAPTYDEGGWLHPQGDWTQHCDHSSYGSTLEKVREAADTSRQLVQLPTYAAWHAHRLEHSPHLANLYPEVHRANAAFWAKQQTEGVRTWAVPKRGFELAELPPGEAPKPFNASAYRTTRRQIPEIFSAAQAAELYGAGSVAHQLLQEGAVAQGGDFSKFQDDCFAALAKAAEVPAHLLDLTPAKQESQERAVAPNLQLPVTSVSPDGADPTRNPGFLSIVDDAKWVAGSTARGTLQLNKAQCAALVDAVEALQVGLNDVAKRFEVVQTDLKRQLKASHAANLILSRRSSHLQLSRDRCARERGRAQRDYATTTEAELAAGEEIARLKAAHAEERGNTTYFREEYETMRALRDAAAAQFRAITGDFPALTGPLVDLFKDVK